LRTRAVRCKRQRGRAAALAERLRFPALRRHGAWRDDARVAAGAPLQPWAHRMRSNLLDPSFNLEVFPVSWHPICSALRASSEAVVDTASPRARCIPSVFLVVCYSKPLGRCPQGCKVLQMPRAFPAVLHMFHDLARQLAALHAGGYVHRDLKCAAPPMPCVFPVSGSASDRTITGAGRWSPACLSGCVDALASSARGRMPESASAGPTTCSGCCRARSGSSSTLAS
jgi:hypothetical protein